MIYAKYTVVLKTLMDDAIFKPLIDKALSTYPIYQPSNDFFYSVIPTREELNTKILNHFKYREIGFETPGRFLDELETAMNEIMPYYNQLMKSQDIMNGLEDPFGNVDIVETYDEESIGNSSARTNMTTKNESSHSESGSSNSESNVENHSKNVKVDTPQSELSISAKDIDSVNYGSEANWNEDSSDSQGNTSSKTSGNDSSKGQSIGDTSSETTGTNKHTLTRKGNQGVNTYAHDMKELRTIFLNIEQMIINDERLQELFMMVY